MGYQKPGFSKKIHSLQPANLVKNPVSLVRVRSHLSKIHLKNKIPRYPTSLRIRVSHRAIP
ncbi:MAG: hypothetical protein EAZ09_22170 [Oscillatoriales cyanobacterium]|nr:MAG: hypothetical protein EAZ68_11030 [Oscillatoriales cyanobacterium]TAF61302.1 MAG: hypothetical protein EAZ59_25740 [Oscillatoriales cyanobacterium]TAG89147.1 MAG: hypothetical protein EAZ18_21155 [Oscillatoriales cyanobacterium]TAH16267.1 MAG: hypothetical protein EAZ09_22170 [Oscillatoriales cyanobacterium]